MNGAATTAGATGYTDTSRPERSVAQYGIAGPGATIGR
jgi:hypothetical protein